jgi:hypothetical protein
MCQFCVYVGGIDCRHIGYYVVSFLDPVVFYLWSSIFLLNPAHLRRVYIVSQISLLLDTFGVLEKTLHVLVKVLAVWLPSAP